MRRFLIAMTATAALLLAACGGTGSRPTATKTVTATVTVSPPAQQQALSSYSPVPEADSGVNGLANAPSDPNAGDDQEGQFTRFIFNEVADFWQNTEGTTLDPQVTFQPVNTSNENDVTCGKSDTSDREGAHVDIVAQGPFYCQDNGQGQKVIYWPMASIFHLPGGTIPSYGAFAEAVAIAHEFGHYVQDVDGIIGPVNQHMAQAVTDGDDLTAAAWSQGLELQADCLAGDWVRSQEAQSLVSQDDLTAAANVTTAIGDDALNPGSEYFPDVHAHGTSALRLKWLNVGITDGTPADCNTWSEPVEGIYPQGQ
jgi:uncharacterized protein